MGCCTSTESEFQACYNLYITKNYNLCLQTCNQVLLFRPNSDMAFYFYWLQYLCYRALKNYAYAARLFFDHYMLTKQQYKSEFKQWLQTFQCNNYELTYADKLCKFLSTIETIEELEEMNKQLIQNNLINKHLGRYGVDICLDALHKEYIIIAKKCPDVKQRNILYEKYIKTKVGRQDSEVMFQLVEYYTSNKQWPEALINVNQLLLYFPKWDKAILARVQIYRQLENFQNALDEIHVLRNYITSVDILKQTNDLEEEILALPGQSYYNNAKKSFTRCVEVKQET